MNDLKRVLQQLPKNKPLLELQLTVAGVISNAFKPFGVIPVVVGGSAVEFYTLGNYTTRDIDLIVEDPEYIKSVMNGLGFCMMQEPGICQKTLRLSSSFPRDR